MLGCGTISSKTNHVGNGVQGERRVERFEILIKRFEFNYHLYLTLNTIGSHIAIVYEKWIP